MFCVNKNVIENLYNFYTKIIQFSLAVVCTTFVPFWYIRERFGWYNDCTKYILYIFGSLYHVGTKSKKSGTTQFCATFWECENA